MTNRFTILAFLVVALLASSPLGAKVRPVKPQQIETGVIQSFVDGDTYWLVRPDGSKVKLREWVEDSPEVAHNSKETDQPFGQAALKYATDHWKGKHVTATVKGRSYDRLVVQTIPQGETRAIGLDLVSVGLAQVYPLTTPKPPQSYKDAEAAAMEKRLGIWSQEHPITPADWRKQQRKK